METITDKIDLYRIVFTQKKTTPTPAKWPYQAVK
jgi:hypothetical protein